MPILALGGVDISTVAIFVRCNNRANSDRPFLSGSRHRGTAGRGTVVCDRPGVHISTLTGGSTGVCQLFVRGDYCRMLTMTSNYGQVNRHSAAPLSPSSLGTRTMTPVDVIRTIIAPRSNHWDSSGHRYRNRKESEPVVLQFERHGSLRYLAFEMNR
jgi:hypothetical protein